MFAIVARRPGADDQIVLFVHDRQAAEEIAAELRERKQDVYVEEQGGDV
jgi:hypothetical protein